MSPITSLELINRIDDLRDNVLDMYELCNNIIDLLEENFSNTKSWIYLWQTDTLDLISTRHPPNPKVQEWLKNISLPLLEWKYIEDNIIIPLIPGGRFIGMIIILRKDNWKEEENKLLETFIKQTDSAIEHSHIFHKLLQRNKELEVIYTIDHIRDLHLEFDAMLDEILKKLKEVIYADMVFMMLYNTKKDKFELKLPNLSAYNMLDASDIRYFYELSNEALEKETLTVRENVNKDIQSSMCIPLVLNDKIIGVFGVLNSLRGRFNIYDQRLLRAIASQADTAIFESLEVQKIKTIFKRYVSDDVVEEMLKSDKDFMKVERQVLTVIFSDLRSFTTLTEKSDPIEISDMLNEYLSAMTKCVFENKGTLDKFIGDCVMAIFGAPIYYEDHALVAIRTAIAMQEAQQKLVEKWESEGKEAVLMGIGINSGEMVVGNIGCEQMTNYTVIGDNVNLASRLEGVSKGNQIVIAENTYQLVKDQVEVNVLPPVKVKGKTKETKIYEVVRIK